MKSLILMIACLALGGALPAAPPTAAVTPVHHKSHKTRRHHVKKVRGQKAPTADRISEIQTALSRDGYYQGDPTGKWDSNTVAALQKFQSTHGIDADGKLDAPTLQKLGLGSDIAGVSAPKPVVPGSSNAVPSTSAPAVAPATRTSTSTSSSGGPVASAASSSTSQNPSASTANH
jgi:peptidoglycan hydrolase-like protein with peptidoglycan-binding domain